MWVCHGRSDVCQYASFARFRRAADAEWDFCPGTWCGNASGRPNRDVKARLRERRNDEECERTPIGRKPSRSASRDPAKSPGSQASLTRRRPPGGKAQWPNPCSAHTDDYAHWEICGHWYCVWCGARDRDYDQREACRAILVAKPRLPVRLNTLARSHTKLGHPRSGRHHSSLARARLFMTAHA